METNVEQLKQAGLPYINDFMVSPFDSIRQAQERCPFGYRVVAFGDIPSNAIRIGQCKVRSGDPEFPLYAVPLSMEQARAALAGEYQDAVNRMGRIRNLINGKTRIGTGQLRKIIAGA